jgi:membrane-bound metal-dependent hydrolase YbcI (DUF457 family)
MPFPVAHAITGLTVASVSDHFPKRRLWFEVLLVTVLANLPDFDFGLVWLTGKWEFHRAFTHSITAALIVGALSCLWYLGKIERGSWLVYSAVVFSHPILDILTSPHGTSMGVMLFWPLSESRFAAGLMRYPFANWSDYHGFELVLKFVYVSILELIVYTPILLSVIGLRRAWTSVFGINYKESTAKQI